MGPSIGSCGSRVRTNSVAVLTLSTSAPVPESPVEYDNMATFGSMPNCAAVRAEEIAMAASCSGVRDDRAVTVGQHTIGQAHQENTGHRRDIRNGPDDLKRRANGVRCGVSSTGHHAVDHAVIHQHGPEIRDIVHDLVGLLDGDSLCLA